MPRGSIMDFEVYCDESRQELFTGRDRNGFVVIGSLWLESVHRKHLKDRIGELRERHQVRGEFKWQKVSPIRERFYLDLVELFFGEPIRFRTIVLAAEEMDAVHFHNADSELMFYKFYYQLLHHWILDQNTYRIFIDAKTNRVRGRVRTLEQVLRNANLTAEIANVQALPSRELDLIQLADVLVGAVSFAFNGGGESRTKRAMIGRIEEHLEHPIAPTSRAEQKFNIFRFRPEGGW
jgi:hypothetical protein